MDVQPFKIEVSEDVLNDLRERLVRTRWPDEITDSGWDYGANMSYVKELTEYWRTTFDWQARERAINAFHHFRASVDGLGIHFIHERGHGPDPLPLIVTHGWPGSFSEMLEIIPMLTDPAAHGADPADSFDVVVPSLPGYGFSDRASQPGMSFRTVADLWVKLMDGLGYPRFLAQGGDWGALVTSRLGAAYPEQVMAVHLNMAGGPPARPGPGERPITDAEEKYWEWRDWWRDAEGGYGHIQGTKPQTLSYGLNDSPAGLCAWIVEKFKAWTIPNGNLEDHFSKDEMLTNITIYWVTQTIGSSVRFYYENRKVMEEGERITVPTSVAIFPNETSRPPKEWAERAHNIQRWTEMPRGGHFAAMEEPALLAEDIRAAFRPLRG